MRSYQSFATSRIDVNQNRRVKWASKDDVPAQLDPLPIKPGLHEQVKPPSVSVHTALALHTPGTDRHSLTSESNNQEHQGKLFRERELLKLAPFYGLLAAQIFSVYTCTDRKGTL
jgi:hypothetical protein